MICIRCNASIDEDLDEVEQARIHPDQIKVSGIYRCSKCGQFVLLKGTDLVDFWSSPQGQALRRSKHGPRSKLRIEIDPETMP